MRRATNLRDPRYRRDRPEPQQEAAPDLDAFVEDVRIYLEARNAYLAASHAFINEPYREQMRAWWDAIRQFRAVFDIVRPSLGLEHAAQVEAMVPPHIQSVQALAFRARARINQAEDAVIQQEGAGVESQPTVNNPAPSDHIPEVGEMADPDLEALLEVL